MRNCALCIQMWYLYNKNLHYNGYRMFFWLVASTNNGSRWYWELLLNVVRMPVAKYLYERRWPKLFRIDSILFCIDHCWCWICFDHIVVMVSLIKKYNQLIVIPKKNIIRSEFISKFDEITSICNCNNQWQLNKN